MSTPYFNIPCVILCGGKSSRMGEDKALLPFDKSKTLTQYQYARLKPHFKEVHLSSKSNKFDFLENKEKLILDENIISSPIVALYSIFNKINDKKVFIITVDNPLVSIVSIKKIIEESKNYEIAIAKTKKIHNLCGVFSFQSTKFIKNMLQKDIHKVSYLINNSKTKIVEFPLDEEFLNLNNKDEYNQALNIISKTNNNHNKA